MYKQRKNFAVNLNQFIVTLFSKIILIFKIEIKIRHHSRRSLRSNIDEKARDFVEISIFERKFLQMITTDD